MNIVVLGAGLIGKTIAVDLCREHNVSCADRDDQALSNITSSWPIKGRKIDISDRDALRKLVSDYDLVVGAVPGYLGFETLQTIIEAGKNVVDISFFPEDPFELDTLAKQYKVTAIVDCGIAPGLCNIIAGYHNSLSPLVKYQCLVGGLPKNREWPFQYKAVFSPIDVIEEYTRSVTLIENGQFVKKDALSDSELIDFSTAGTLEAVNTDGLRTLLQTMQGVCEMNEKTLRYPGHFELMRVFRESGFFSKTPVAIDDKLIQPLDLTCRLLFPKWRLKDGEEDFTIMRVTVENEKGTYVYSMYDEFDRINNVTSMARTTAFTCTAAVDLMAKGWFSRVGICPPEYLGAKQDCYQKVIRYLQQRGVQCDVEIRLNSSIDP